MMKKKTYKAPAIKSVELENPEVLQANSPTYVKWYDVEVSPQSEEEENPDIWGIQL